MENSQNPIADLLAKQGSNAPEMQSNEQSNETPVQSEQGQPQETSIEQEPVQESVEETVQAEESTQESQDSEADDSIEDNNPSSEESDDSGSSNGNEEETPWWEQEDSKGETTLETNESSEIDFSSLSNALGIEGTNQQSIVEEFNTLRQQNEDYKKKVEELSVEPKFADEKLAKANEIAKNGGDYLGYLDISQTDWDLVSDTDLVVATQLQPIFGEDVDGMNKYLSELDQVQLKLKGQEIRNKLKLEQQQSMEQIRRDAAEKRRKTDESIRKSLDETNTLYGVKLNSAKKKELYNSLTTGDFLKELFYTDGKPDSKKMVTNAYLLTNIKEIMKVNVSNAMNSGKKQVFDEASNPQVKRPNGQFPAPTKKETTALGEYMQSLQKGGPN